MGIKLSKHSTPTGQAGQNFRRSRRLPGGAAKCALVSVKDFYSRTEMVTHNGLDGTWSEDQASAMFIIFTGVAGAGKTTVGKLLAKELSWRFYEGDDFHPAANVEKLRRGEPLTDDDRRQWFDMLRDVIQAALERGENGVLACSALKRSYRARLRVSERVIFVHLAAGPERYTAPARTARRPFHESVTDRQSVHHPGDTAKRA